MSGGIFFTSDTHFRHGLVAELRGFPTPEAHDEAITGRWNATVRPGDTVWHLGDVGMRKPFLPLVRDLHGTVHLVTGNHDACWPGHRDSFRHQREWLDVFASVQAFARRKIAGRQVMLSHFPYEGDHTAGDRASQYRLRDEGLWLLHGHTHGSERMSRPQQVCGVFGQDPADVPWCGRQIHVGLDAWGLRPVPLHALERMITEAEGPGGACGGMTDAQVAELHQTLAGLRSQ